jgi:dihydroxyacetone kinase-like protein
MSEEISLAHLRRWLLRYADLIQEQEGFLTELDAAIGDADHGVNMRRGLTKVRERLLEAGSEFADVGTLLRVVAMTLISSIGGAAGPLYGAFFLCAAKQSEGSVTILPEHLARMLRAGLEGVQQRGKAQLGDKTMLDTIAPAVEAFEAAVAAGRSLSAALRAARDAAATGMELTISLQATKGRASYLGSRSIGHQDPGATSSFLLFQSATETLGVLES